MSWTKTETLSNTPDSLGRKNVVETWSLKDRDGVAVATITKDADDEVTLNVSGQPKVYRALLTQTGTDAPVATVLENTLGDIAFSYADVGDYSGALTGAFPEGKTVCALNGIYSTDDNTLQIIPIIFRESDNNFKLTMAVAGGAAANLWVANLTILVYP